MDNFITAIRDELAPALDWACRHPMVLIFASALVIILMVLDVYG